MRLGLLAPLAVSLALLSACTDGEAPNGPPERSQTPGVTTVDPDTVPLSVDRLSREDQGLLSSVQGIITFLRPDLDPTVFNFASGTDLVSVGGSEGETYFYAGRTLEDLHVVVSGPKSQVEYVGGKFFVSEDLAGDLSESMMALTTSVFEKIEEARKEGYPVLSDSEEGVYLSDTDGSMEVLPGPAGLRVASVPGSFYWATIINPSTGEGWTYRNGKAYSFYAQEIASAATE